MSDSEKNLEEGSKKVLTPQRGGTYGCPNTKEHCSGEAGAKRSGQPRRQQGALRLVQGGGTEEVATVVRSHPSGYVAQKSDN